MRKSIRFSIAAVIAAVGLSILGIGAAIAAPGKPPAKPAKVMVMRERAAKDRSHEKMSSRDRTSRDKAAHAERGDRMR
jgi:hypothetical protein